VPNSIVYEQGPAGPLSCENTGAAYLYYEPALLAWVAKCRQKRVQWAISNSLASVYFGIPSVTWCQQNSFAVHGCCKIRYAKYSFLLKVDEVVTQLMNYKLQGGAAEHTARRKISLAHAIHCRPIFHFSCPTKESCEWNLLTKIGSDAKCWLDIFNWGAGLAVTGRKHETGQNMLQYMHYTVNHNVQENQIWVFPSQYKGSCDVFVTKTERLAVYFCSHSVLVIL